MSRWQTIKIMHLYLLVRKPLVPKIKWWQSTADSSSFESFSSLFLRPRPLPSTIYIISLLFLHFLLISFRQDGEVCLRFRCGNGCVDDSACVNKGVSVCVWLCMLKYWHGGWLMCIPLSVCLQCLIMTQGHQLRLDLRSQELNDGWRPQA